MSDHDSGWIPVTYLVLAVVIVVWGALGLMDQSNVAYAGYQTTPQNVVNQVRDGSPAAEAGIMIGDRVTSVASVSIEDVRALNRLPRAVPSDSRVIGIERGGSAMTLTVVYAGLPLQQKLLGWLGALIGLAFIGLTLRAHSKVDTDSSDRLAKFGLCFGLAFLGGPYIASVMLRNLVGTIQTVVIVVAFALLVHFLLGFPKRSAWLDKPSAKLILYGPAALVALIFAYLFIAEPTATGGLNDIVSLVVGLFVVGYFGTAIVTIFRRYQAASPEERAASGMNFMLWGTILGLAPVVITSAANLVAPMLVLPGSQFYFVSFAAIPLAFSAAVIQAGDRTGAAPASGAAAPSSSVPETPSPPSWEAESETGSEEEAGSV